MTGMTESIASISGVDLCLDPFGDTSEPAVVLTAGGAQSMVWWEDEFSHRLAAAGRQASTTTIATPGRGGLECEELDALTAAGQRRGRGEADPCG